MADPLFAILFYITAGITILSTLMVVTRNNAVHAILYLIVSSLSTAVIFYLLGAPFAAALEVIIYAGAVMILFVFVVMMLNAGQSGEKQEEKWTTPRGWIGPSLLTGLLLAVMLTHFTTMAGSLKLHLINSKQVGITLFGPYLLIVELASFLLLAGLIGAYHIARSPTSQDDENSPIDSTQNLPEQNS